MKARGFWQLSDVSDERLLDGLRELLAAEGRSEARIVAHLAEVDERRIHLKAAAPSLFEYCRKRLGLSDSQAYYRIAAARAARRFPVVFELLERREIHLTNIAPLAKHLTAENHPELLGEAGRLSKRELLRWLAQRYPQLQVPSYLRKLPGRRLSPGEQSPRELSSRDQPSRELVPKAGAASAGPTGALEPRSESHYRLQLNIAEPVRAKLEMARDLMSHANPSGDLVVVVERGLDLLIAQLQKTRLGQTSRPRKRPPRTPRQRATRDEQTVVTRPSDASQLLTPTPTRSCDESESRSATQAEPSSECADLDRSKSSRNASARGHISRETLRRLVERDGPCCGFTGEDGTRCNATAFLEIDHRLAWARGGSDAPGNLRWRCRAHNQLQAEQDFGKQQIQQIIMRRRSQGVSTTSHGARDPCDGDE